MMRNFEINDEWKLLAVEIERIIFYNLETHQIFIITPTAVSGYVDEIYDDIDELTFELDERLNLKIWRDLESVLTYNDRLLSKGECYDLLIEHVDLANILAKENKQLKKEKEKFEEAYLRVCELCDENGVSIPTMG